LLNTWYLIGGVVVGVVAIGTIGTGVWRLVRGIWRLVRGVIDFLDDWVGEVARPGVPPRAGVMERLGKIEHEVVANNGTSLKDAVHRIEDRMDRLEGGPRS
jgi:hypothetical protein